MTSMTQRCAMALLAAGCAMPSRTPAAGAVPPGAATDVVARVNGALLTRGEAERILAAIRAVPAAGSVAPQVPGMAAPPPPTLRQVAELFVLRTRVMQVARSTARVDETVPTAPSSPHGNRQTNASRPGLSGELLALFEAEMRRDPQLAASVEARLPAPSPPTSVELADAYERNREALVLPERVRVRQILVAATAADTAAAREAKRWRAEELRGKVVAGGDFAECARENSDCPSRTAGGELGVLVRGQMHKALEDAAFAAPVGEISGIVESPEGFHFLQVLQHLPAGALSLDEAKPWLIRWMATQRKRDAMAALLKQLVDGADIEIEPAAGEPPTR